MIKDKQTYHICFDPHFLAKKTFGLHNLSLFKNLPALTFPEENVARSNKKNKDPKRKNAKREDPEVNLSLAPLD